MKSQPQSLFSGKKFSENAGKIILKESKTKSRVILISFFGKFFLEVSAAELINSIEHNYYKQQANKTSRKKLFREQNKANKVSTESLFFKLFFEKKL